MPRVALDEHLGMELLFCNVVLSEKDVLGIARVNVCAPLLDFFNLYIEALLCIGRVGSKNKLYS